MLLAPAFAWKFFLFKCKLTQKHPLLSQDQTHEPDRPADIETFLQMLSSQTSLKALFGFVTLSCLADIYDSDWKLAGLKCGTIEVFGLFTQEVSHQGLNSSPSELIKD